MTVKFKQYLLFICAKSQPRQSCINQAHYADVSMMACWLRRRTETFQYRWPEHCCDGWTSKTKVCCRSWMDHRGGPSKDCQLSRCESSWTLYHLPSFCQWYPQRMMHGVVFLFQAFLPMCQDCHSRKTNDEILSRFQFVSTKPMRARIVYRCSSV